VASTIFLFPTALGQSGSSVTLPPGTTLVGVPNLVASGRALAQTAANASVATFTVGAADGSFQVSMNMNVTAATTLSTTLTCTYTDESTTVRTLVLPVAQLAGTFIAAGAVTATGPWLTAPLALRCKAATPITLATAAGTFTGVTYTVEGFIYQTA
jgi:hypothetical protein